MRSKHYYLISARGKPVRLDPERVYTFGRHKDSTIVLADPGVSRLHATLRWEGDGFVLQDEGSRNGTQVNGQRTDQHALADGDRFRLGGYEFHVRSETEQDAQVHAREERRELLGAKTAPFERPLKKIAHRGFAGSLLDFNLVQVLESLMNHQKTGLLTVQPPVEAEGRIYFRNGEALHAEFGDVVGAEAVYALVALVGGEFRFESDTAAPEVSIDLDTISLVIESCQYLDDRWNVEETRGY